MLVYLESPPQPWFLAVTFYPLTPTFPCCIQNWAQFFTELSFSPLQSCCTAPPKPLHCCRHRFISHLTWSLIGTTQVNIPSSLNHFLNLAFKTLHPPHFLPIRLTFFTPLLDASDPPNWWMLLSPLNQSELVQIPSPDLLSPISVSPNSRFIFSNCLLDHYWTSNSHLKPSMFRNRL